MEKILAITAEGQTNIWDALNEGIEQVKKNEICASSNTALLLLTDGEPNMDSPEGILQMLDFTLMDIPNRNFSISTFGFGYNLDS
jgi:uncharacterized protein with von Willebrand factor type A (vWA) domain